MKVPQPNQMKKPSWADPNNPTSLLDLLVSNEPWDFEVDSNK